jgi:hypothetical protein
MTIKDGMNGVLRESMGVLTQATREGKLVWYESDNESNEIYAVIPTGSNIKITFKVKYEYGGPNRPIIRIYYGTFEIGFAIASEELAEAIYKPIKDRKDKENQRKLEEADSAFDAWLTRIKGQQ